MYVFVFIRLLLLIPYMVNFCVSLCSRYTPHQHLTLLADKHLAFMVVVYHKMRGAERSLDTVLRRRTPLRMVVNMSPVPSAPSVPV